MIGYFLPTVTDNDFIMITKGTTGSKFKERAEVRNEEATKRISAEEVKNCRIDPF